MRKKENRRILTGKKTIPLIEFLLQKTILQGKLALRFKVKDLTEEYHIWCKKYDYSPFKLSILTSIHSIKHYNTFTILINLGTNLTKQDKEYYLIVNTDTDTWKRKPTKQISFLIDTFSSNLIDIADKEVISIYREKVKRYHHFLHCNSSYEINYFDKKQAKRFLYQIQLDSSEFLALYGD